MAFVVTENCNGCRFTNCVAVCPVDCFHGDLNMLYIDPDECIDCGACENECPVGAIYEDSFCPENLKEWVNINKEKASSLPLITEEEEALPGAEERMHDLGF